MPTKVCNSLPAMARIYMLSVYWMGKEQYKRFVSIWGQEGREIKAVLGGLCPQEIGAPENDL